AVGDRYAMETMREGGYNLGGEQSGHIIFLDYTTTGDGLLTALQLDNVLKESGKPLSELAGEMTVYPHVMKNVRVRDKESAMSNPRIKDEINGVEAELGEEGRVLVRLSGTEPLVRVMVEAPTKEDCETYANRLAHVIDDILGLKE